MRWIRASSATSLPGTSAGPAAPNVLATTLDIRRGESDPHQASRSHEGVACLVGYSGKSGPVLLVSFCPFFLD